MEMRLRGTIEDGRLLVELPPNTRSEDVDVVVSSRVPTDTEARNLKLFAWLDELHADPLRPTRTREEIDAYLRVERDSWE